MPYAERREKSLWCHAQVVHKQSICSSIPQIGSIRKLPGAVEGEVACAFGQTTSIVDDGATRIVDGTQHALGAGGIIETRESNVMSWASSSLSSTDAAVKVVAKNSSPENTR